MSKQTRRGRQLGAIMTALVLTLSLAACGSTKHVQTTAATNLKISYSATTFTNNFNFLSPTNSTVPPGSDLVYEPLRRRRWSRHEGLAGLPAPMRWSRLRFGPSTSHR